MGLGSGYALGFSRLSIEASTMHHITTKTRPAKVIGLGFHKTGTKTLGACLETLGFRNHSLDREAFALWRLGEIDAVLDMMQQADSFEDWPWPFLYREARERFPDARFVLTTRRDEVTWLESLTLHVARHGRTSFNYRKYIYGVDDPVAHPQRFLEVYRAHNAAVREFFADQPDRLLEICWEDGHGWERLCGFLGLPVPDAPLPHMNRRRSGAPLPSESFQPTERR
jgi:hypothetical protein